MLNDISTMFRRKLSNSLWSSTAPIREELFGLERLEEHATSLATAQLISKSPPAVLPLQKRLDENSTVLLNSYRDSAAELEQGESVVPAAEWLLDNYHLVEAQIREVRDDLPDGYYRQLPKLASGPLAGYPRVFGLTWSYVAHTDSHVDPEILIKFVNAYQNIQPLTIGELWAVAITLRIVLIENLRRLADQITVGREAREDANQLTDCLLAAGCAHSALQADITSRSQDALSEVFAAQLAKRLRDQDPKTTPALEWLEQRLTDQNLTVDEVVQNEQKRQGASNVSIRNIITSMRLISDIDWEELFEQVSVVDKVLRVNRVFTTMDFSTRNLYRSEIEQLARGSNFSEVDIAQRAIKMANAYLKCSVDEAVDTAEAEQTEAEKIEVNRLSEPGYYLIDAGRLDLEKTINYKAPIRLLIRRLHIWLGIGGYVGSITIVALSFVFFALVFPEFSSLSINQWLLLIAVGFIPATEVATSIVHRLVSWRFGAVVLPGLELKSGVPESMRTLIAVPTLLTCEADLLEQIERLQVHYLSGIDGDVSFALLTDGVDADQEELAGDAALLALATAEIDTLNAQYSSAGGKRFLLLHRRRRYNVCENKWMGWERKRGKLRELNQLLRGATNTTFMSINGVAPMVPEGVRYVITLDADTRLPRETALRLIGKMAHPLNRPRFDENKQRVVAGYGILQPRVTPSLSVGIEGSLYQRIFSAPGGIDPYAAAISDVYQDLFGEGSFTGKGIYDVDMFEAAIAERVPENTMLSHDLFEGIFARAGLASDVEVVEEFPARYDVAAKRQHRWIRGDWQLLPWILGTKSGQYSVPYLGRWKLLDNLRRSLVTPMTLLALMLSWLLPLSMALFATALLIATIAIPAFIPTLFSIFPHHSGVDSKNHFRQWLGDLRLALSQTFFSITFLPDQTWRTLDAIVRTLVRLWVTHENCLEWTTAAHCNGQPRLSFIGFYRTMAASLLLAFVICLIAVLANQSAWLVILPFALLWCVAPILALFASRAPIVHRLAALDSNTIALRLTARRTWRYFEVFVTSSDNMLPPDNFQQEPKAVIAHRTSPTNIGLYLLSCIAARDFGWTGLLATIERLEVTFSTLEKLPKYNGHLFNWYDTQTLHSLMPEYISSVDSGNLAGHLIALANSCDEWRSAPFNRDIYAGLSDNISLCREAIMVEDSEIGKPKKQQRKLKTNKKDGLKSQGIFYPLIEILDDITGRLNNLQSNETLLPFLIRLTDKAIKLAHELLPASIVNVREERGETDEYIPVSEVIYWLEASRNVMIEHQCDRLEPLNSLAPPETRLKALAKTAREMALAMNFSFLIDQQRQLLSIGYSLTENSLDPSCYDLLASEARLASLFAIAKGDVATKHWFRLGRTATPMGNASALISWSGSMFEYLMPSLVMQAPAGSLLEQTNRLIVQRQQDYGKQLGIPWGVSESAYNARDLEFTYQYSNFGVPGLGLKRGLIENIVIAPYATGLAAMVDPQAAVRNYNRLTKMGACGSFGFFEALDFTPSRIPTENSVAIVRSFMAHHQGMTIVAIANTLHEGQVRRRFHREPMIQACELLLQERMPRDVSISHPRAEEVKVSTSTSTINIPSVRFLDPSTDGPPNTHLLSNGSYAVMLTATGAGYSRWRDFAVTRWQEDTTRDPYGSFIFLRDVDTGKLWSNGAQPLGSEGHYHSGGFDEDHAEFIHIEGSLTTTTDVLVSGEDDGEVRRISLSNNGHSDREIEITSYVELVLTAPHTDNAHPAFAKMFVQTEYLDEYAALVATRRKRTADEPSIWAAHFAVVEAEETADPQYETNRSLFIGRGNSIATADAFNRSSALYQENITLNKHTLTTEASNAKCSSTDLSNTVGTVLDPIFSLRNRVRVPSGGIARVAFWTVVASSKEELLDLIDRHHDRSAYDRAKTLAWTQAQVQLRHLNVSSAEAADFQQLAAPILYADPRFRTPAQVMHNGMGCQSILWANAIAGDLPIVLLHIDDVEDIAQVKQLLRAHEYWRMKRIGVDLVIINEHAGSYLQDLQISIETAVRSSQSHPHFTGAFLGKVHGGRVKGTVHMLREDLISMETRDLLKSVARVVLIARRGSIGKQIARVAAAEIWQHRAHTLPKTMSLSVKSSDNSDFSALTKSLEFFNGLGGFGQDGQEYTVILDNGATTPAPWINVIANPNFGFHVSAEGSGYTWAENSRENQLTPWCNDPVSNPSGEAIYVRDEDTLELFSATADPLRDYSERHGEKNSESNHQNDGHSKGTFIARHGRGYSQFEHQVGGLSLTLLQYVPLSDPIKISRLTLHNKSDHRRRFSVTAYTEWVLGIARGASAPFITTELDEVSNAILISNSWSVAFPDRIAFADMRGKQTEWTTDRTEFLGRNGSMAAPASLLCDTQLSRTIGAGLDPCSVQQSFIELEPNESTEIEVLIGQTTSVGKARELITRYRETDLDLILDEVKQHWNTLLGTVQVKTPDRAMDIMLNGWLLYQTVACRMWARSAFYQASGAYGFRDQLQDGMALTFRRPDLTRAHILRAAGRQFIEGDVQHWWLPHTGQGVRTRISDDRVWLAFATASYIQISGDIGILSEQVPFIDGPELDSKQHDAYFQPVSADESATLFEHCARGLDQCIRLTGVHGLPLMGTGDWNDGMNRVGEDGKGESVWLGWLFIRTIELIALVINDRNKALEPMQKEHKRITERIKRWQDHANAVAQAIEKNAWDGEWYRRATFDNGYWLGAKNNDECQIDSIAQSWAVLSGAADHERAIKAMSSVEQWLIKPEQGLALLFTPPFNKTDLDPGYIKGYPPGLRENGGQYSHAAMWNILAYTKLREAKKAHDIFALLNPINHARNAKELNRYKVEPYVVAADIYSVAPHIGHGGWTWYTGAAGWMYKAGMEGILGINREGNELTIQPCIPPDWSGFDATIHLDSTDYSITVKQSIGHAKDTIMAVLDERDIATSGKVVRVALDGGSHNLVISIERAI